MSDKAKETKTIRIGMTEVMPIFDMPAWGDIEERFGSLKEALAAVSKAHGWQRPTAALTTILCNRTIEISGGEPLREKDVMRMIHPQDARSVRNACLDAITRGSRMEHKPDEDGPVDLVLAQIESEKKADPAE